MKLLVYFSVFEGDKAYAHRPLGQLLDILAGHDVDVLIIDDASPSKMGETLKAELAAAGRKNAVEIRRLETSSGYRGTAERMMSTLDMLTSRPNAYDYVIRIDPDLHFCRKDVGRLFEPGVLPEEGLCGSVFPMRKRDVLLLMSDLSPIGFARKRINGRIEREWGPRFFSTWWHDIGWRALLRGFRGRIVPGCFMVLSGKTLRRIGSKGWFKRDFGQRLGLCFGDDTLISVLTHASGAPLVDCSTLVSDWTHEDSVNAQTTPAWLREQRVSYIHPLKNEPWAMELRAQFS